MHAAGGAEKLAKAVGRHHATVSGWSRIPAEHLRVVARVTGIPMGHLRPDIFEPHREPMRDLSVGVGMLGVILAQPLWPKRSDLNPDGQALYDRVLADAKPLIRAVFAEQFAEAFRMLAGWAPLITAYIDTAGQSEWAARDAMMRVTTHYIDAAGVDWSRIEKRAA